MVSEKSKSNKISMLPSSKNLSSKNTSDKDKFAIEKLQMCFGSSKTMDQTLIQLLEELPMLYNYSMPTSISGWLKWAREFLRQHNFEKAQRMLEMAKKLDQTRPEIYFNLGLALFYQKQYEKGIKEFEKCIEFDPCDVHALLLMGLSYYELCNNNKALEMLQSANRIDPKNNDVLKNLALVYQKMGMDSEATKYAQIRIDNIQQNDFLKIEDMLEHYNIMLREEPGLQLSIFQILNNLGWSFLTSNLTQFSSQIAEFLIEMGRNHQDIKTTSFGKDLLASTLSKSNNLEDLKHAVILFEEAKGQSEKYYSSEIYGKTLARIENWGVCSTTIKSPRIPPTDSLDREELNRVNIQKEIIKFISYPEDFRFFKNQSNPQCTFNLGFSAIRDGNIPFGKALIKKAIIEDPNHHEALLLLAQLEIRETKSQENIENLLLRAYRLIPKDARVLLALSEYYYKTLNFKKALPFTKLYVDMWKKHRELQKYPNIEFLLGNICLVEDRINEALIFLENSQSYQANQKTQKLTAEKQELRISMWLEYAKINFKLKNLEKTEHWIKKILEKSPNNQYALMLQYNLSVSKNVTEDMEVILDKLVKLIPNNPLIWFYYGKLKFDQDQMDEAKSLILNALKIQSYNHLQYPPKLEQISSTDFAKNCFLFLGKIMIWKGQYKLAIKYFDQALAISESKDEILLELARCKLKDNNIKAAERIINEGLRFNNENADLWFELGNIAEMKDEWPKASQCWQKSLFNGHSYQALQKLVKFDPEKYQELHNFPVNGRKIEEIMKDRDLCQIYGIYFLKQRNFTDALQCFSHIQQLDPSNLLVALIILEIEVSMHEFRNIEGHKEKLETITKAQFQAQNFPEEGILKYKATLNCIWGKFQLFQRKYDSALQYFTNSLNIDHINSTANLFSGITQFLSGNYQESSKRFEKLLEIQPTNYIAQSYQEYLKIILKHETSCKKKKQEEKFKLYYHTKLHAREVDVLLDFENLIEEEISTINPSQFFSMFDLGTNKKCRYAHRDGHVIELVICGRNIAHIPPSIGKLTYLQKLILKSNKISELPQQIQHLKQLLVLDLSGNEFLNFPKVIFKIPQLVELNLSCTRLSYIPKKIEELTRLKYLNISSNDILGISYSDSKSTDPEKIFLHLQEMRDFHNSYEYEQLQKLQELEKSCLEAPFFHNKVKFNCQNGHIVYFSFQKANLKVFPEEIIAFRHLQRLNLTHNSIEHIPPSIQLLFHLEDLDLSYNSLKSIPMEIHNLQNLTQLRLRENPLESLPDMISNMPNLDLFEVENLSSLNFNLNRYYFKNYHQYYVNNYRLFHQDLLCMQKLEDELNVKGSKWFESSQGRVIKLNLQNCPSNNIPLLIGHLTALKMIHFGKSKEKLQIANQNLAEFYHGVRISPREKLILINIFANISQEVKLLYTNEYCGDCGSGFAVENKKVIGLALVNCGLTEIPDEVWELENLKHLLLSKNQIQNIPNKIVQLLALEHLDLSSNQLQNMPRNLDLLNKLRFVDISNNSFQKIDASIMGIPNLKNLYVYNNPWNNHFLEILKSIYEYEYDGIDEFSEHDIELLRNTIYGKIKNTIATSEYRRKLPLSSNKNNQLNKNIVILQKNQHCFTNFSGEKISLKGNRKTLQQCFNLYNTQKLESRRFSIWIHSHTWDQIFNSKISIDQLIKAPLFSLHPISEDDCLQYYHHSDIWPLNDQTKIEIQTTFFKTLIHYVWDINMMGYLKRQELQTLWRFNTINSEVLWIYSDLHKHKFILLFVTPSISRPLFLSFINTDMGLDYKVKDCSSKKIVENYRDFKFPDKFKRIGNEEFQNHIFR